MTEKIPAIRDLYQKYILFQPLKHHNRNGETITVNDIVSKASFFYEKIRSALDYSEEHLLRKNAISRILSRRLFFQKKTKEVAESLILELIRARYLPNKTLPESLIGEVAKIIEKYHRLLNTIEKQHSARERQRRLKWVMGIAASEIEAELASPHKEEAIADHMYEIFLRNYPRDLPKDSRDPFYVMLYTAIQMSLLKADKSLITYRLFLKNFPEWKTAKTDYINHVAKNIGPIIETFDTYFKHKKTEELTRWAKKYTIIFIILRDLLEKHGEDFADLLNSKDRVEKEIKKVYDERLTTVRKKIRRGAVRSIIYIFFTKMLVALLLEIPYDRYVHDEINMLPLQINIGFPPLLMLFMGITIRFPKKENLEKIKSTLLNIIYDDKISLLPPKKDRKQGVVFFLLQILYLLSYGVSYGLIIYGLWYLGFNMFSGFLFVLFLSLASFLGFRLRQAVKEISFVERRDNIITTFIGFLTTPFLRVGNWISRKFSRINVFIFILDVLIEAPFQLIVEILEQWFSYMKEKRDELS